MHPLLPQIGLKNQPKAYGSPDQLEANGSSAVPAGEAQQMLEEQVTGQVCREDPCDTQPRLVSRES